MKISVSRPTLGNEEVESIREVFATGWLGLGDRVKKFEDALAQYLGAKHVVGVSTGTSALHLALMAAGVGPGDEVLLPSITFVACPQAVLAVGAKPVFCEVEEDTLCLSLEDVKKRTTSRTKAIMPVHYGGQPCDMDGFLSFAEKKNIVVIEDAAHAFGSRTRGRLIGSFGHMTCFSFDPIKVLTCGEGGAVATSREDWARKIQQQRLLGIEGDSWTRYQNQRRWYYDVPTPGYRYHMSNISAAVGLVQLGKVPGFIARRCAVVKKYNAAFSALPGLKVLRHDVDNIAPFMYVVRVLADRRDDFMAFLKERGVDTGVHYIPNHLHSIFKADAAPLPVTDRLYSEIVSLPLFSHITEAEVEHVVQSVKDFFAPR
jgi:dTDP-4-amino-4,6-dideoxygalactose transaminase